ncbi:MAG: hypothetical protein U0841_18995 [Chloroflexia bacterium]
MAPSRPRAAPTMLDLYALGIILYQMLTGRVPYSGNSTVEVLMKHLQDPLPMLLPASTPCSRRASSRLRPESAREEPQRALRQRPGHGRGFHRGHVGRFGVGAADATVVGVSG